MHIAEMLGLMAGDIVAMAAEAEAKIPADDAEMVRLAGVALRESIGASIAQDWQEAALRVCRAVVRNAEREGGIDRHAWRDAVIDALVVSHIYTAQHDTDPRKALADLLAWEVQVALDPAVSKDAAALVARGRAQALKEAITTCEKQGTHEEDMGRSKEAFGCDLCVQVLADLAKPEGEPS